MKERVGAADCAGNLMASIENISDKEYYGSYGEKLSVSLLKRFYDDPTTFGSYLENRSDFEEPKTHLILGQAVHCLTLEGREAFDESFQVTKCLNPKTSKSYGRQTKAWAKHCKDNDLNIWRTINEEEFSSTQAMALACQNDPVIGDLIKSCNRVEYALRGKLSGVDFQGKMDAWDGGSVVFDLKTTADISDAESSGFKFKYGWQSIAYKRLLSEATGCDLSAIRFAFGFVEKATPHRTKLIESEFFETRGQVELFDNVLYAVNKCRQLGDYSIGGLFM